MTKYYVFVSGIASSGSEEWELLDKVEAKTPKKARMKVADTRNVFNESEIFGTAYEGDEVRLVSVAAENVSAAGYEVQEGGGLY